MFGLVLILAGMVCLFIAFVTYQQTKHFTENVKCVKGKIVDIKIREFRRYRDAPSFIHQPVIQYEYEGKQWQFQSEYDVRLYQHDIGSTVFVHINPENPSLVGSAEDISGHQLLMIIFAGMGLMLPIGGLMAEADLLKALSRGEYELNLHPMLILIVVVTLLSAVFKVGAMIKINLQNQSEHKKTVWGLSCNATVVEEE